MSDSTTIPERYKRCSICKKERQVSDFHHDRTKPDGRHSVCKDCRSERAGYTKAINHPEGKKRCSKCGAIKAATIEYFGPHKRGKFGLTAWCRQCLANYDREWKRKTGVTKGHYQWRYKTVSGEVECSVCHQSKPLTAEYFRPNHKERLGYYPVCRDCLNLKSRNYRQINPDSSRRAVRKWQVKHPEYNQKVRSRRLSLPFNYVQADWQYALDYFNACCAVCGRHAGFWHCLAQDHWIPLNSLHCPGTIPTNIIPLCHGEGGCNNSKCDRDPVEWLTWKFGKRKANKILKRIQAYFDSLKDRS